MVSKILETNHGNKEYKFLINEQTIIENMLSKEVTFLIYINLIKQAGYTKQWRKSELYFLDVDKMKSYGHVILLDEIVSLDEDIKKQFLLWFKDALYYNDKINENLHGFSNELDKYLT